MKPQHLRVNRVYRGPENTERIVREFGRRWGRPYVAYEEAGTAIVELATPEEFAEWARQEVVLSAEQLNKKFTAQPYKPRTEIA